MQCNPTLTVKAKKIHSPEAWAEVYRKVLVAFLKATILANVVQVIASDHNRPLHFHLQHYAGQDSSADAHIAGKWTFLVYVVTLDCLNNANKYYSQQWYICNNMPTMNCSSNSSNNKNYNNKYLITHISCINKTVYKIYRT